MHPGSIRVRAQTGLFHLSFLFFKSAFHPTHGFFYSKNAIRNPGFWRNYKVNNEPIWLEWAKRLNSIAQAGLTYSREQYDIEKYQQVQDICIEILNKYTEIDHTKIRNLFTSEISYFPTKCIDFLNMTKSIRLHQCVICTTTRFHCLECQKAFH